MKPSHPRARRFALTVLRDGTNPGARNLAAAYLADHAELAAYRKAEADLHRAETQRVNCALRKLRRENAERLGVVLAKVDEAIAEIDRKESA